MPALQAGFALLAKVLKRIKLNVKNHPIAHLSDGVTLLFGRSDSSGPEKNFSERESHF
jgi:hypothetical protein